MAKLLVDPVEVWYEISLKESKQPVSEIIKANLKSTTAKLYEEQTKLYRAGKDMAPADRRWLSTVLKEGTLGDKLNAMSIQIQESPFYGLEWINKLMGMAISASRHESYPVVEVLKDVFLLVLPPKFSGRKMISWRERALSEDKTLNASRLLLIAYFEDIIRQSYIEYLRILEIMLHDQVSNGREKALRNVFELALAYKSDFTDLLLQLLVNKLGDPDRKIASRVVYYLQNIIEKHEELTIPIIKRVQVEVMKANGPNDKATFYGLNFYSQLRLDEKSTEITEILLGTYQHFLQSFLQKLEKSKVKEKSRKRHRKGINNYDEHDEYQEEVPRVVKVVLIGLTRAIPFSQTDGFMGYADKLLSIADRIKSFPILLQASLLIFGIFTNHNDGDQVISESSFELLSSLASDYLLDYHRVISATSYHPQLFKLLYKITSTLSELINPKSLKCLRVILKSLLTTATSSPSQAYTTAALLLVNAAFSRRPELRMSITFPEDDENDQLFWELVVLSKHFHPTISRYASVLLQPNGEIDIKNEPDDPFLAMSNSAFLDRFIKGTLGIK